MMERLTYIRMFNWDDFECDARVPPVGTLGPSEVFFLI